MDSVGSQCYSPGSLDSVDCELYHHGAVLIFLFSCSDDSFAKCDNVSWIQTLLLSRHELFVANEGMVGRALIVDPEFLA